MSGNLINTKASRESSIRELLNRDNISQMLMKFLPKGLTPGRLIRQTLTLVSKTPKLAECHPTSILGGMIQAAEIGLELSSNLGQAWLIPRYDRTLKCMLANFQIGWKGYVLLAYRSNRVIDFPIRLVLEPDDFAYEFGTSPRITHVPHPDKLDPSVVPEACYYYAVVHMTGGGRDIEVMSKAAVQQHRMKYSPPPKDYPDRSAWATNFDGMAMKTVAAKLARRLPLQGCAEEAIVAERRLEDGEGGMLFTSGTRQALEDLSIPPEEGEEISDADFEVPGAEAASAG